MARGNKARKAQANAAKEQEEASQDVSRETMGAGDASTDAKRGCETEAASADLPPDAGVDEASGTGEAGEGGGAEAAAAGEGDTDAEMAAAAANGVVAHDTAHAAVAETTSASPPQAPPKDDGAATPLSHAEDLTVKALAGMGVQERETELRSQVTGLNAKLVNSFNRIADLEDNLMDAHSRILVHTTKIAELHKEREQHLFALNTGLLVEKVHVTTEMQRMMDRVIDETTQRGKAESDKTRIEAELEELSASLFNEANKMVAVERLARAQADAKSEQLAQSLRDTESVMSAQQDIVSQLQAQVEKLRAAGLAAAPGDADAPTARALGPVAVRRTLCLGTEPYREFLAFLEYLRGQHRQLAQYFDWHARGLDWTALAPNPQPMGLNGVPSPVSITGASSSVRHRDYPHLPMSAEQLVMLSNQTSVPFIRRALEEDTDPCLRLQHAPGLNWLSRRQAASALLDGSLVIEPLFSGGVVPDEEQVRAEYGMLPPVHCALSGIPLLNVSALLPGSAAAGAAGGGRASGVREPQQRRSLPSLFHSLRRSVGSAERAGTVSPSAGAREDATEIFSHEFAEGASSLPIPTHSFRLSDGSSSRYLLSPHSLLRLRTVCAFWTLVRTLERAIVLEGKSHADIPGIARDGAAESEGGVDGSTRDEAWAARGARGEHTGHDDAGAQPGGGAPREGGAPVEVAPEACGGGDAQADGAADCATGSPRDTDASRDSPHDDANDDDVFDEAEDVAAGDMSAGTDAAGAQGRPATDHVEDANAKANRATASSGGGAAGGASASETLATTVPPQSASTAAPPSASPAAPQQSPPSMEPPRNAGSPGPRLPARRSTPAANQTPARGELVLPDDRLGLAWEEGLWTEVVRLKESMWKARTGVDLGTLDLA
ncbi:hypothetical protein MSPP1_001093 [Malassezia sp. CBS 17886]|nr:hypothetical protein MSPP1_001093 [Malassezia sp. CBS 17886]